MRSILPTLLLFALASTAAQEAVVTPEPVQKFSIESSGRDVRDVLHTLFTQARKSYILDTSVRHQLYMTVYDVDFDTAFSLLLEQAKLEYEIRDGVYYIGARPVIVGETEKTPAPTVNWEALLSRNVSLKQQKVSLSSAYATLGKSAGVRIKVEPSVPNYLVNVSFNKVSLRYALDTLGKAAQLAWEPGQDGTIRVFKPAPNGGGQPTTVESSGKANVRSAPGTAASKCPNCKHDLRDSWKYCPGCGYWVKPLTTKG